MICFGGFQAVNIMFYGSDAALYRAGDYRVLVVGYGFVLPMSHWEMIEFDL